MISHVTHDIIVTKWMKKMNRKKRVILSLLLLPAVMLGSDEISVLNEPSESSSSDYDDPSEQDSHDLNIAEQKNNQDKIVHATDGSSVGHSDQQGQGIHLSMPDSPHSQESRSSSTSPDSDKATSLNLATVTDRLEADFEHDFDEQDSNSESDTVSVSGADYTAPTEVERQEMLDFVRDQLKGATLTRSQVEVVVKVTDSFLSKLFKKLLRKSIKRFVKGILKTIVKEVQSAKRKNAAVSDADLWALSSKIYKKKLAQEAARKAKYIKSRKAVKK